MNLQEKYTFMIVPKSNQNAYLVMDLVNDEYEGDEGSCLLMYQEEEESALSKKYLYPDLILIDYAEENASTKNKNALSITREVKERFPDLYIAVLACSTKDKLLDLLIQTGSFGFREEIQKIFQPPVQRI